MNTIIIRTMSYCVLYLVSSLSVHASSMEKYDWLKSESDNFTVYSALSEKKTTTIVRHLEQFRQAVTSNDLIATSESIIPTEIFIFRKSSDLRRLGKQASLNGLFVPGLRNNSILINGSTGINKNVAVLHEYSHYLLSSRGGPHYPLWFEEGIAQLLSHVTEDRTHLNFGDAPRELVSYLQQNKWMPLRDVLTISNSTQVRSKQASMLYSLSWLTTNYLVSLADFQQKLDAYLSKVNSGRSDFSAFEEAFGLTEGELKLELKAHLRGKDFVYQHILKDDVASDHKIILSQMNTSEAALKLGQLALKFGQLENATHWLSVAEKDSALTTPASSSLGDVYKFRGEFDRAEEYFQKVVSSEDKDAYNLLDVAEYWHRRAVTSQDVDDQISFMDKAHKFYLEVEKLNSEIPELYVQLGLCYVFSAENDQAVEMFSRAEELLPGNLSIRLLYAESLMDVGRHSEARSRAQSILNGAHTSSNLFKRASAIEQH